MPDRQLALRQKERNHMRSIKPTEHYSDQGDVVVMSRTSVREYSQVVRIADHLCLHAEELLFSTEHPTIDNCRIAGMMLGLAYSLVPLSIEAGFGY
jgi:hypothetical protein